MITLPKKGKVVVVTGFGAVTATLRKAGRAWSLRFKHRVRWGNAAEIRADIKYFQEWGKLPPRIKGGWA